MSQLGFLNPEYPPGFSYFAEFISVEEEVQLLDWLKTLPWKHYEMDGYLGKRMIVSFGAASVPSELKDLLPRVSERLGEVIHILATWYPTGSQIGWHRDAPQYEKLLGISLNSACTMKLKAYDPELPVHKIELSRRSAYVIENEARWKWEHHIPKVSNDRYSLTFRTQGTL